MDSFLKATQFLLFSFITDQSRFFKIPIVLINWVILVGASVYFWSTLPSGSTPQITIAGGIIIAFLIVTVSRAILLIHLRAKKRQYLYKLWRGAFNLQSYDDYNKDSSKFLKISWDGLKASEIEAQGEVGGYNLSSIRRLKEVLGNLDKTLPRRNMSWILNFKAITLGTLKARPVLRTSDQYIEFSAKSKIYELVKNIISYSEFPDLEFVRGKTENGIFIFDEVYITNLSAQNFGDYTQEKMNKSFRDVFPLSSSDQNWVVESNDGGEIHIFRISANPTDEGLAISNEEEQMTKTPLTSLASQFSSSLPPLTVERKNLEVLEKPAIAEPVIPKLKLNTFKPLPPLPPRPTKN